MTDLGQHDNSGPPPDNSSARLRIEVDGGVYLSGFVPADKAGLVEHLQDREISNHTLRIPYPYTENDAETWFQLVADVIAEHGEPVHFAIRQEGGQLIGAIGFDGLQIGKSHRAEIGKSHRAEIGYWLGKRYWGGGIMTRVVAAACDYAFGEWDLAKITAHVFDFNPASARVLEKCGFQLEGRLRKHYVKNGQYIDALAYGLFR